MSLSETNATLRRFFAGLSEYVFETELGVADPPLIDYVSQLLYRFLRADGALKVKGTAGGPWVDLSALMLEAQLRVGEAQREVHRQLGDFALFWAGLFPESLRRTAGTQTTDRFADYCQQGKRAYLIASQLTVADDAEAPGPVLERLSHEFEMCAYGLREVRREWERRDGGDSSHGPLLFG